MQAAQLERRSGHYREAFHAFTQLAPRFAVVKLYGRCVNGAYFRVQDSRPALNGEACQCCGTRRLKTIWPVSAWTSEREPAKVEEAETIYWIGRECWQNLQRAGLLLGAAIGDGCCYVHVE